MNRFAAVLAGGVLLFASAAHAQDKTFTLNVTAQDLQVLSAALDELPRKTSEPLVEKFQKQLIPQMQPPAPVPPAEAPKAEAAPPPAVPGAHPSF